MYLRDLSWPAVDEAALLVVPLGSTEQHGPHLPFSTDTDVAEELARRLADAHPEAVVAPAIAYGSAGEHAGFPGTLSIGRDALTTMVVELVRSSHFRRTVIVNGHGGNHQPLAAAVDTLTSDGHDVLAWSPAVPGGDAHAGRVETSLFLAAFPQRVGPIRPESGNREPLANLLPALREGRFRDVAPDGVLGDPGAATAELGMELWARLAADLIAAVDARFARAGTP